MWELPRTSHSCRDQSLSWSSWGKCGLSSDAVADPVRWPPELQAAVLPFASDPGGAGGALCGRPSGENTANSHPFPWGIDNY